MYAQTKAGMKGSVEIITYVKVTRLYKPSLEPRCFQVKILTGKTCGRAVGSKTYYEDCILLLAYMRTYKCLYTYMLKQKDLNSR
jgi:hypothetical protein